MDRIRYYKGKYKIERITKCDPSHKAGYKVIESFNQHKINDIIICPVRLCWNNKK